MTQRIYKYTLEPDVTDADRLVTRMPVGAQVLHYGLQDHRLCVWAQVDDRITGVRERYYRVHGTGDEVVTNYSHLFTWQDGPFVWHLYG